ncbi:MAG: hypothetical protein V1835_06885 [Candidatus Micrarchaeota archaeon]
MKELLEIHRLFSKHLGPSLEAGAHLAIDIPSAMIGYGRMKHINDRPDLTYLKVTVSGKQLRMEAALDPARHEGLISELAPYARGSSVMDGKHVFVFQTGSAVAAKKLGLKIRTGRVGLESRERIIEKVMEFMGFRTYDCKYF